MLVRSGIAAAVAGSGTLARAQAAGGIIDVHHHLSPPPLIEALRRHKVGERPLFDWTPTRSIEDMDRAGVATSITSIATPGIWFGDNAEARAVARECNDYAAKLSQQYPGRFGIFASIPLPDVDGALREIEYAFEVLKADGIGVMTSLGDRWLGDARFAPVMEELNRRNAILYTHPTYAYCCRNVLPDVHDSIVELVADTSRAIANILFTGTATRYPNVRFIFSHAGGTIPFTYQRLSLWPGADAKVGQGVVATLQKFYYDTAQVAYPIAMAALTKLVPVSQVLFGTDFPFRTSEDHVKGLQECGFATSDLDAVLHGNARRVLPSLAAR